METLRETADRYLSASAHVLLTFQTRQSGRGSAYLPVSQFTLECVRLSMESRVPQLINLASIFAI